MSEIPSGWFDDPEDPTQLRYWDGNTWTEHRTPKTTERAPESSGGVGSLLSGSYRLALKNWKQLLGIWAIGTAGAIAAIVVFAIGAIGALSPNVRTILERITETGFDPNDPSDEAFLESISLDPNASFWILTALATILLIVSVTVQSGASASRLVSSLHNQELPVGACLKRALRCTPRWIGIYVLWMLLASVAVIVILAITALAFGTSIGVLWLIAILALIALFVIAFPIIWMLQAPLLTGPRDQPPLRAMLRLARPRWPYLALRVLVVNLVVIGCFLLSSVLQIIPILGLLIGLATGFALESFALASVMVLYRDLDGRFDPELSGRD